MAPTANGWFRAITLHYDEEEDSVVIRLADYGGFLRVPRQELRQIRSDLTSLPMQAIECYLAHGKYWAVFLKYTPQFSVQPVDGTSYSLENKSMAS